MIVVIVKARKRSHEIFNSEDYCCKTVKTRLHVCEYTVLKDLFPVVIRGAVKCQSERVMMHETVSKSKELLSGFVLSPCKKNLP